MPALNIAVAGGGIAGLTAALAFAKNGHEITVFERAKAFEDNGAGIQISANACRVLRVLNLEQTVKAISFEPDVLQLSNGKSGRVLSTLPFKTLMQKRYDAPYLVAHRGDLQGVLLGAARSNPLINIETGTDVGDYQETPHSVIVGAKAFDLLIAADGIGSNLRPIIDPHAKIVIDGQTASRATLPIKFAPSFQNAVSVYLNAGAHLVIYPMGHRPVLNLVYVSSGNQPPNGDGFCGEVKALIDAAQDWKAWPLASVVSAQWHKGRAMMIGDAAHAMTPHAAQGGALAIEDAFVLAECIQNYRTIISAFEAFQAKRQIGRASCRERVLMPV